MSGNFTHESLSTGRHLPIPERLMVSIKDFCALCSIGKTTAYKLIHDGKISVVRVRGRTLVTVESIKALIVGLVAAK